MDTPKNSRGLPLQPCLTRSDSQESSVQDVSTDNQSFEGSYEDSRTAHTHVSSIVEEERPKLHTRSSEVQVGPADIHGDHCNENLNCTAELVPTENLTKEDIIVLLMGHAGSGKRTFIDTAVGIQGWTSHSLRPSTEGIQAVRITLADSTRMVLVDTPSIDDICGSDLAALMLLSGWLRQTYENGLSVSGILFLHRVSCHVATDMIRKHVAVLEALCGEDMYRKVIFITTMWQDVDPKLGDDRESELMMINGGSKALRLDLPTQKSAREILDHVTAQESGRQALQIQKELVDLKKDLPSTRAAQERFYVVKRIIAEQKNQLRSLKEEIYMALDPRTAAHLAVDLTRLEEMHEEIIAEMRLLDSSWSGRFRRLFQTEKSASLALRHRLRSLVSSAVMNPRQRALMRALTGDDAQQIADYLGLVLHKTGALASEEGKNKLSLLGELAKTAQAYPRCYALKGIKYATTPVDGGSFADIHKGKYKGQAICLKVFRVFGRRASDQILRAHVKELVLWAHLSHPNILPFYGVYLLDGRVCSTSPWMDNGNLCEYLGEHRETPRMPFLLDIIAGLEYLHNFSVVHGDLKAKNILVSDDGRALIADFGLSHVATASKLPLTKTANGTAHWRAPELLVYGSQFMRPMWESDIWSFGCLCYEVLTGKIPFYQYSEDNLVIVLRRNEIPLGPLPGEGGKAVDPKMWAIMERCWNFAPQGRPGCQAIREFMVALPVHDDRPPVSSQVQNPRAFWKGIKAGSGVKFDYRRVEEILQRIQE